MAKKKKTSTVRRKPKKKVKRKIGRPTKKTPQLVDEIRRILAIGADYRTAAHYCEINESTLRRWREDPEFQALCDHGMAQGKVRHMLNVVKTANGNGRHAFAANVFWLKSRTDEFKERRIMEVTEDPGEPDTLYL